MTTRQAAAALILLLWQGPIMAGEGEHALRFDREADRFTESCLVGSGRLGAMVFGRVRDERVVLNEEGMWSGSVQDADREGAAAALPEIRRLLLAGENAAAERIVNQHFTCAGLGSARGGGKDAPYGCYQLLGDLVLEFQHPDGAVGGYKRLLRLDDALAQVEYAVGGTSYRRECFASAPGQVVAYRIRADRPGAVAFTARLQRPENAELRTLSDGQVEMFGQLPDGRGGDAGVRYAVRLRVVTDRGEVTAAQGRVGVRDAQEAVVLVTAATAIDSFAGRGVTDPAQQAEQDMHRAAALGYEELKRRHIEDHQRLYNRVGLRIGAADADAAAPLGERLAAGGPASAGLVELLFNYGRYLLIGSSRPGGFPANLQGIWAEELQTPWNCDWHANVNVQMNYWPAGPCGLVELEEPLVELIGSLVEPGRRTARKYYDADGWVAHLLINPWGFTSPGESASWGSTPTCSAWLCQHLWDHYLFTRDPEYLRRVYPVLKGASEFYKDMLIEEPTHHWLVTAPSNSPENAFLDAEGRSVHTCMGPAGDQQLLRYLFDAVIAASRLLEQDAPYREELIAVRDRLAPTQIGADGRVLEWLRERPEADPHHRHISHLWGLFPGVEINRQLTPELAEAAEKSLDARGDGGTGWAIAYKACLWARLGDGDRALRLLQRLLRPMGRADGGIRWSGGVYPNLLDAHPPFQIDGNFGATAAVAEMLLQSRFEPLDAEQPVVLDLLPALPSEWAEGEVSGLRGRGGVSVAMTWRDGRLTRASLASAAPQRVLVRTDDRQAVIELMAGEPVSLDGGLKPVAGPGG